jgi:hypothetical protein
MTRKSVQEINFPSDHDRHGKVAVHKKCLPIVRCVCGSEILVVPDLKAMTVAIKRHVAAHRKVHDDTERMTEFLTEQVLLVASKNQD